MPDIGFRLVDLVTDYSLDEISKEEFKKRVTSVEESTEGVNWWTVCIAIQQETHKSNYTKVLEPLLELYNKDDLKRIFSTETIEEVE